MSVLNGSEAFAAWLPFWGVPFSYAVAVSYVLVDTADKGVKAYQLARLELGANASLHPEVDTPRCVLSLHKAANPPDADLLGLLLASFVQTACLCRATGGKICLVFCQITL